MRRLRVAMAKPDVCQVCCHPHTAVQRKPVGCLFCGYTACLACVQQYLLSTPRDAGCMACSKPWNREFLASALPKTWMHSAYKQHREKVLLEREISLLPSSQHLVDNFRAAKLVEQQVHELDDESRALQLRLRNVAYESAHLRARLHNLRANSYRGVGASGPAERRTFVRACPAEGCRGFLSTAWKCGVCAVNVCARCHETKQQDGHECNPDNVATAALIAKDTRPCPKCASMIHKIEGCFGVDTPVRLWSGDVRMSQDIRAGDVLIGDDGTPRTVLDVFSGEDDLYRVDQTRGMSYVVNSKHTLLFKYSCRGVEVEMTVDDYLAKDASYKESCAAWKAGGVAAPNEGVTAFTVTPIGRGKYYGWVLDGNKRFVLQDFTVVRNCDQMWCTQCNVAFSWRTGQIVTSGAIHNPHYYEFIRRTHGGVVPRNAGDVPCGGLCLLPELHNALRARQCPDRDTRTLLEFHRSVRHVEAIDLARLAGHFDAADNADLRLQYLVNDIDKDTWKRKLQQREKKRDKDLALRQVYEMYVGAASETFRKVLSSAATVAEATTELRALLRFANVSLETIGRSFNVHPRRIKVPYF